MIRRALLIAAMAVALSAAGALAFTPAVARAGRSWSRDIVRTALGITLAPRAIGGSSTAIGAAMQQDDTVRGTFCPVRPPAPQPTALTAEIPGTQMSIDTAARPAAELSPADAGKLLLPPAPALCRANASAPPMQSTDHQ